MKIDRTKVKKSTSEVSEECRRVIQFLKQCGDDELLKELEQINVWYFGKCELYHWIDVLDRFDGILATVAKPMDGKQWIFQFDVLVDVMGQGKGSYQQSLIFHILKFTALLIEHSYARHLYNSIEHLIMLLDCADGNIILAVLNLIYVFSKRSNYLSRLPSEKKKVLQEKLVDLAQTWGGLEAGCALDQCCSKDVPAGAGNVYFEYYINDNQTAGFEKNKHGSSRFCIDLKNINQISTSNVGEIMENIIKTRRIPDNIQMSFYHRLRLAHAMTSYKKRLQFVQARLQALSILVYSNSTTHINILVYDGLIEEIVNTLKLTDENYALSEVKASCLKTLTAIIHLDRNPRLQSIIDSTGAMSYHGFLPTLVRQCIQHMTNSELQPFPQQLATSLFSFLYHLASYESGCESLVSSGLIEPLLKVVLWPGQDDHITFVTRAVRVIDLITNLDMAAFQTHSGLNALVGRLESEVKICSAFHGPSLPSTPPVIEEEDESATSSSMEQSTTSSAAIEVTDSSKSINLFNDIEMKEASNSSSKLNKSTPVQCLPQRAALLKSILNFLKKAIPDPAFVDNTRTLMDENLQNSLKMIISNAEYYGALLFLLATDVVTVFIFHEPSLLSSLQDSGLTWVVLRALIVKDVPATRENLASLPNTLSALCLNTRGLQAFVKCKPFERLFGILMSPEYLPAMKRRRSSDPQGDTAMNLGSAMDELMRHQPTLKTDAMKAIIQLLQQLSELGSNLNIIAFHPTDKTKSSKASQKESDTTISTTTNAEDPLSDDEMEEEYRSLLIRKQDQKNTVEDSAEDSGSSKSSLQRKYVPVVDYVLNVTKFLDNILSNNGTDDHCVEFVRLNGLKPLYSLLKMPNFPLEFPLMPACNSISQVCKSIAMLSQENKVFKEGLTQLNELTDELDALYSNATTSGSVLLHELAASENPLEALYDSSKTPIVHAMSAIHAYINVFVFLSRGAQTDVRNMSIEQWGSDLGKCVLKKLSTLYMKLVWESSTLLTLCTPNIASEEDLSFAAADLGKLTAKKVHKDDTTSEGSGKKGMSQLTLLKWLLTSSSHLGRALAELFGLLVHQCVGSQGQRLRRHNPNVNPVAAPTLPARAIASLLTNLLMEGLSWKCPGDIKVPRLRLTFYICSVGFSTPMLFDNLKNPYHLMLQEFQKIGGVEALFKAFDVVLEEYIVGRRDEDIKTTVGIGEFLEGWLGLVNRLSNTKYLFESTHLLPTSSFIPGYVPFDAAEFMTRVHKHAFNSIMKLWQQKVFKSSDNHLIAERILSIFCHIIKGESLLPEKFTQQSKQKEKPPEKTPGTTSGGGGGSGGGMYSEIYRTPAPTTFGVQQPALEFNESHMQRFVDMGFSQQHAREALIHSRNNFEAATEYLLTTPVSVVPAGSSSATANAPANATAVTAPEGMDVDMSEEDMMIQAIAMSLVSSHEQPGELKGVALSAVSTTVTEKEGDKKMDESTSSKTRTATDKLTVEDLQAFSGMMGECMKDIFYGSLELLDAVPSTVHTVCDLHLAMAKRNGETWRNDSLRKLTEQIMQNAQIICDKIVSSNETEQSLMKFLCDSKEARQLSARLHLFLLMSQGLGNAWATVLQKDSPFNLLIMLLKSVSNVLTKVKQIGLEVTTPDLLAPLLLTFDQIEKIAMFAKRKRNREKSHTWKWFDDRSGRWCNYSTSNNSSIDTAYQAGESTVRFTAGRRRYMVFFKTLVQINEDTGNRRPIMLDVMPAKKAVKSTSEENTAADAANSGSTAASGSSTGTGGTVVDQVKEENQKSSGKQSSKSGKRKVEKEKQQKATDASSESKSIEMSVSEKEEDIEIPEGLNNAQIEMVIEYCVDLIRLQVNPSTLNGVMRLLLRFTREYDMALCFARRNGVQYLLNLTESSSFPGALPLASLLLRHIVEDVETMKHAVDRAVAFSASSGVPNMFCGVGQNSVGAKELHYLLRALGPIACRNAELYNESTKRIMRISTNSWRGQPDKNVPANTPQIVKVPPDLKSVGLSGNVQHNTIIEDFVHVLLSTLVERYTQEAVTKSSKTDLTSDSKTQCPTSCGSSGNKADDKRKRSSENNRGAPSRTPQLVLVRRLTGEHIDEEEMTVSAAQQSMSGEQLTGGMSANVVDQEERKPLLSLSVILRLLAELSKSYAAVARLIVDYTVDVTSYGSGARQFLTEGSILSFIFDCLLPHTTKEASTGENSNKESKPNTVSTLARQLLSVLGSYWHNVDIQNVFVTELKNSLSRTLHLPESKSKHQQLQALFNLITSMIETAAPISFSSHPPLHNTGFIKLLIKRGLISDLARIAHNLDLSSHDLVSTINVMLKPLEKLSNLANSQNLHPTSKQEKDAKDSQTASAGTSTTRDDGTSSNNVQGSSAGNISEQQQDPRLTDREEMQDLEGIVEVMVAEDDGEAGILAETLLSNDVEGRNRFYITPNPRAHDNSSSSSDSSDREEHDGDRFDDLGGNVYPLDEDTMTSGVGNEALDGAVAVGSGNEENIEPIRGNQIEVVTSSQNDLLNPYDILSNSQNSDAFAETIIIERGDEDEATLPRPDIDDEEDDDDDEDEDDEDETDDEEGNDDDDDDDEEGSDMDADDTIAAADDAIIFDEGDDATDDVSDPFADLDDHGGALEFSFPQRPYTVHIPQLVDTGGVDAQTRSSLLSHPLLLRSNEQASRPSSNDRSARGRTGRGDRGLTRQHGNAIHIHGNSGSFARILIGEEMASGSRVGGGNLGNLGDDIFLDMFGDGNQSTSGLLNSVPSALSRWTVESRLLDGASVHDCVNALKPDIIQHLEKIQFVELQEKMAEEKRKKEEIKKNENIKTESSSAATSTISTTSSSTFTTAPPATSATSVPASATLESTTTSGYLVSSVLTSQEFPVVNMTTTQSTPERMDVSPTSVDLPGTSLVQPENLSGSGQSLSARNFIPSDFNTPAVSSSSDVRLRSTVASHAEVASFITPANPMPEVLPNAPQRDGLPLPGATIIAATPASAGVPTIASPSISSILAVSSRSLGGVIETPQDLPRMNRYRGENAAALTGGLGFTPQIPASSAGGTPRSELPSVAEILATPADIPSLQQLRSSSLFPQSGSPSTPQSIRSSTRENLLREMVPSPLSIETTTTRQPVASSTTSAASGTSSGLAADLAAAIMSQLVTSSPTPSVTTTAQSVDTAHLPLLATYSEQTTLATSTTTQYSATSATSTPSNSINNTTATTTTPGTTSGSGSSTVLQVAEQIQRELENLGIPEGVDPSFLAALPENIREEVLRDQFGIRLRSTAASPTRPPPGVAGVVGSADEVVEPPQEVSPEFLAALPEEVQREVLEQQRLEQARFTAAQQRPEQPVDPGEFLRNLNPTLRRQVLADMDDSVLAVLPPELTNEAQGLRRELQQRRLQIQAERALTRSDFSQLLRHRGPGSGFQSIARLFPGRQINTWKVTDGHPGSAGSKKLGRQLLDPESLTCLLVLLFLNDSTLNASRLHRILRNLSYHNPTKHWIIFALISILRRTSSFHQECSTFAMLNKQQYATSAPVTNATPVQSTRSKTKSKASKQQASGLCEELPPGSSETSSPSTLTSVQQSHWLSRTLNLAFGGCVNIFQLQKIGRKSTDFFVTVHQQACLDVCKQTLEALSFLAKNFPSSFSPSAETSDNRNETAENTIDDVAPGPSTGRSKEYGTTSDHDAQSEFWDILVRLNSSMSGLKGKATSKTLKEFPKLGETSAFVTSPLGQILSMLSHPVVKQSTMLTDKLLRLLAVISMSLPERPKHLQAQGLNRLHERVGQQSDNAILPPDNPILPPEIPHSIHTVTFADTDDILTSNEPMLPPSEHIDEYEPDTTSTEAATVCSETTSVASSLFVEPPEIADSTVLRNVRSPRPGSIVSAFSDGTVVHSDMSGAIGEQSMHHNSEQDADTMAMDVDAVSHLISDTSSGDNRSSPGLSMEHLSPEKEPSILIGQLRMAVNVLTTGSCSDEGLEDATTLLLQLSRTEPLTRDSILELLLEGAQETANCLRNEIKDLLHELKERNNKTGKSSEKLKDHKQPVPVIVHPSSSRSQPWPGRGGRATSQARRVRGLLGQQMPRRNVPKPVIYDLHLPAMATLTAKRSSQSLFLRILKVILQLRDAAKKIAKKPQGSRSSAPSRPRGFRLLERLHHGGNSLREVVAALEADMEAMYEMIDRFGGNVTQNGSSNRNANQQGGEQSSENAVEASTDQPEGSNRDTDSQETEAAAASSSSGQPANPKEGEEKKEEEPEIPKFPCLSSQIQLDDLWDVLGEALTELAETTDTNAVLVLQPAVESFFLVHGSEKEEEKKGSDKQEQEQPQQNTAGQSSTSLDIPPPSPGPYSPGSSLSPASSRHGSQSSSYFNLPADTQKFLRFAETHRTVLNQILRQSSSQLSDGPFAVLVNHTRLLDFDIKRRYFRQELEKEDKGHRREDMAVHIRRDHVFEDSYRELHRRSSEEIKNRLYIVFDGEEGQDAGGLLREWYSIMAREMFNPNYALFTTSQGEKATYLPNRNSHFHDNHLSYFKFAGRIVAKAIYDNKLLDCYFTRSFYKHILSKPVTYTDMESEDYSFYQGLVYLLENHINDLGYELTFSLEVQRFGLNEVHDLKPNGRNIVVTEETKREYVKLVCIEKMTGSIRKQIDHFLEGFYEVIPRGLISIFDEQELELLIAGLPTIDIEDLKMNTEYHKYTEGSLQIQWFWRALRSFDQADRAKFLQFVTGTSKVPLQGFSMLEGMNGVQKFQIHRDDRSTDRLPCAHTCFNQLDLPPYETYDKLFSQLLKAVQECSEGFGLA